MNSNPTGTLVHPVTTIGLQLCLAPHPKATRTRKPDEAYADLQCTRLNEHTGHCCDEVAGVSWELRGRPAACRWEHDHSKEKADAWAALRQRSNYRAA
jgi:hypothetical protein